MYLLVFVTLVVALTGIYAEVMTAQTRQLYGHQTTVAAAMEEWQATALAQARYAVTTTPTQPGLAGCDLTTNGVIGNPCQNTSAMPANVTVDGAATLPVCSNGQTSNCWMSLPTGYQTAPYKFYSVYYQTATGQNCVVTFVPQPTPSAANPPPGFVQLPGAAGDPQVGITMSDLLLQIKNTAISPLSYGTVTNVAGQNSIVTSTISGGNQSAVFTYPVPASVPVNSVALISSL